MIVRTLLTLTLFFASLVLVTLLLALSIWLRPQWIFSPERIERIVDTLYTDRELTYENLSIRPSSSSFWTKRVEILAKELCFSEIDVIQVCIDSVELDIEIDLYLFGVESLRVHNLLLDGDYLHWLKALQTAKVDQQSPTQISPHTLLREFEQRAQDYLVYSPENLALSFNLIKIEPLDLEIQGVSIGGVPQEDLQPRTAEGTLTLNAESLFHGNSHVGVREIDLEYRPTVDLLNQSLRLTLNVGSIIFEDIVIKDTQFQLSESEDVFELSLDSILSLDSEGSSLSSNFNLVSDISESGSKMELKASLVGLKPPLSQNQSLSCKSNIPAVLTLGPEEEDLDINCLTELIFNWTPSILKHLNRAKNIELPRKIAVPISISVDLNQALSDSDGSYAHILGPLERIDMGDISLNALSEVILGRKNSRFSYRVDGNASLRVHDFSTLKSILKSFDLHIPQPFSLLKGSLDLDAEITTEGNPSHFVVPLTLSTDLSGEGHSLKLKVQGLADLHLKNQTLDIKSDILIYSWDLPLPPFDPLSGLPQLSLDDRIKKTRTSEVDSKSLEETQRSDPTPDDGWTLTYDLRARTSSPTGLRVHYHLFYPHAPMGFDISATSKIAPNGEVKVTPFSIRYLNRSSDLKHLTLRLPENPQSPIPLEALWTVQQTNYLIYIDILGTLEEPQINLRSEPSLDREDIISVLLYDRTSDQLASADAETVGALEAALADRAIGLLSLWALSSTPFQGFSYNPATGVYSAQIRIDGQTTASLGSDFDEQTNLELRRRISQSWMIRASMSPGTEGAYDGGKIMLQWERRY